MWSWIPAECRCSVPTSCIGRTMVAIEQAWRARRRPPYLSNGQRFATSFGGKFLGLLTFSHLILCKICSWVGQRCRHWLQEPLYAFSAAAVRDGLGSKQTSAAPDDPRRRTTCQRIVRGMVIFAVTTCHALITRNELGLSKGKSLSYVDSLGALVTLQPFMSKTPCFTFFVPASFTPCRCARFAGTDQQLLVSYKLWASKEKLVRSLSKSASWGAGKVVFVEITKTESTFWLNAVPALTSAELTERRRFTERRAKNNQKFYAFFCDAWLKSAATPLTAEETTALKTDDVLSSVKALKQRLARGHMFGHRDWQVLRLYLYM